MIPRKWLDDGERELSVAGEAYLQGVPLAEVSVSHHTVATQRRIVMLDGVGGPRARGLRPSGIFFQVPWSCVHGYWTGVMPFPPELWREGPEGEVVVLVLDPEAAGGRDVVIHSNLPAWVAASRDVGIPEIRD
ncbi:MAG TPA: hypothetical protein VGR26_00850 [Acidimicrobiales bacterium]|nr:hypothetical protein [Acidimicrobiales bacterium]